MHVKKRLNTFFDIGNFYLDIETTGLDSKRERVITIQFQELDRHARVLIGKLHICGKGSLRKGKTWNHVTNKERGRELFLALFQEGKRARAAYFLQGVLRYTGLTLWIGGL